MIKIPPIPSSTVFGTEWINWIFKFYEWQKKAVATVEEPVISAATPSTHKVKVIINGQTYYILLSNT